SDFSEAMQAKMSSKSYVLKKSYTAEEIVGIFGVCELAIGMRLHSIIYAAAAGTPAIGISYDPKVSGFVGYIGTSESLELDEVNEGKLLIKTEEIIENREKIKEDLKSKVAEFREKTKETAKIAMNFIKKD
ncbi:MAG: polysaccharide pyruvyl transferase family protein, partial [Clostridia bacterium]|nr:polysaccharide pyruvyl transferase family protein [Clostridia bacterium]